MSRMDSWAVVCWRAREEVEDRLAAVQDLPGALRCGEDQGVPLTWVQHTAVLQEWAQVGRL
jgi:hypothetical protein